MNKTLVADFDDLIFGDEKLAEESSIYKNGHANLEKAIDIFKNNLEGLMVFDKVICSTRPLAGWAKHFNQNAQVSVMPNFIPTSLLSIHRENQAYNKERSKGTIGYFAGTKSHDKDFPVVLEAMSRTLIENPNFSLLVVGPVKVPYSIAVLDNVTVNPVLDYFRLASIMWSCETVIAPLELSGFNDCKSRVKFLEASLSGCRLIASPITDMKDVGSKHITLPNSTNDWYEALSNPPSENELAKLRKHNFEYIVNNCQVNELLVMAGVA